MGANELIGKARDEIAGLHVEPEIVLLGEAACGRCEVGERFALARPSVVDDHKVAILDGPRQVRIGGLLLTQHVQGTRHVFLRHGVRILLERNAFVFGQGELGNDFKGGGELERLPAAELYLLDIRGNGGPGASALPWPCGNYPR